MARHRARGNVALSNANIRGSFGLRACIVNHLTTEADIEAVIAEVLTADEATALHGPGALQ